MKKIFDSFDNYVRKADNILLLGLRLLLAYGFYKPALMKWNDISAIGKWFESLGYPFPMLNAYLAGLTELLGVVLLFFGLGTRIIAIPLIIVMFVAIFTVHLENGFEASNNGFEIPLYYAAMLMVLVVYGSGKFSIDKLLGKKS